eukprot:4301386-Amphidinium_carterae.1
MPSGCLGPLMLVALDVLDRGPLMLVALDVLDRGLVLDQEWQPRLPSLGPGWILVLCRVMAQLLVLGLVRGSGVACALHDVVVCFHQGFDPSNVETS